MSALTVEVRAALAKATPGEWRYDSRVGCVAVYAGEKRNCLATGQPFIHYVPGYKTPEGEWTVSPEDEANAEFIALAHNAMPGLLADLDAAEQTFAVRDEVITGLRGDAANVLVAIDSERKANERADAAERAAAEMKERIEEIIRLKRAHHASTSEFYRAESEQGQARKNQRLAQLCDELLAAIDALPDAPERGSEATG